MKRFNIYKVTIGNQANDVKIEYVIDLDALDRTQAEEFCREREFRTETSREVYFAVEE